MVSSFTGQYFFVKKVDAQYFSEFFALIFEVSLKSLWLSFNDHRFLMIVLFFILHWTCKTFLHLNIFCLQWTWVWLKCREGLKKALEFSKLLVFRAELIKFLKICKQKKCFLNFNSLLITIILWCIQWWFSLNTRISDWPWQDNMKRKVYMPSFRIKINVGPLFWVSYNN